MKFKLFLVTFVFSNFAFAASDIDVKVTSLSNAANSTILEACGTAVHKTGVAPLLVSVKHSESLYTTMTGQDGKWCLLLKRWNFKGTIDVSASSLSGSGFSDVQSFSIQQRRE